MIHEDLDKLLKTVIYAFFLFDKDDVYYIKCGQTTDPKSRYRVYQNLSPFSKLLAEARATGYDSEQELFKDLLYRGFKRHKRTELFYVNKSDMELFSSTFKKSTTNRGDRLIVNNFPSMTGCYCSGGKSNNYLIDHEYCDIRCSERLKLAKINPARFKLSYKGINCASSGLNTIPHPIVGLYFDSLA